MTNTSRYSSDVETMEINDGGHSWDRERTSDEIKHFLARRLSVVGELDPVEYETIG